MTKSRIIIGAGMGGLSAGIYGQINGYETQIFEMHTKPGGQCSSWNRKGYTFDAVIHHFFGCKPGTNVNQMWHELGALPRKLVSVDMCTAVASSDGKLFIDYYDLEMLQKTLYNLSPADSRMIEQYIRLIKVFTNDKEINADLVDMVRGHSRFNGGIYAGYPDVGVVVDEGRRFMQSRTEPYDLIFLSLPVTNTSRSLEGYALTENFLFTLESMAEYWDRLTAEGTLAVVGHNDAEILRLLVLALNMMEKRGFSPADAMKHVYVVSSGDYLCFVLRRTAFTPPEAREMHRAMVEQGFQPGSSYFPFMPAVNPSLLAVSLGRLGPDMLDEVDAPLNDSNTERFCELVKRMSPQTQFIFITHNKIAMEMAEQLIGVTMQEQGVSRIVAVDSDSAMKLTAEAA